MVFMNWPLSHARNNDVMNTCMSSTVIRWLSIIDYRFPFYQTKWFTRAVGK